VTLAKQTTDIAWAGTDGRASGTDKTTFVVVEGKPAAPVATPVATAEEE
jgi:hypothetical protein